MESRERGYGRSGVELADGQYIEENAKTMYR
jgi:hypothetical protein